MSEANFIEVKNLSKNYGSCEAVKGISFNVKKGEIFGFAGPDGAGKTTTIRMMCGILPPSAGEVTCMGIDCIKHPEKIKKEIAYMSQKFSLYQDLSIDENIDFFGRIHRSKNLKKRREELLELTGLGPFRKRLAGKLSGGMKQKLALACALVHEPKLFFLDEPTTGVDPVSRREFWKLLVELPKQGITLIMTSPYMDEGERCMTIALMHEGKIIKMDSPEGIKKSIEGQAIEVIVSDIRKSTKILQEQAPHFQVQSFGDRINIRVSNEEKEKMEFRNLMDTNQINIQEWRPIPTSLENAFISYMEAS